MSLDGTHLLRADRLAFQQRVLAAPGWLGDLEAAALQAARRGDRLYRIEDRRCNRGLRVEASLA